MSCVKLFWHSVERTTKLVAIVWMIAMVTLALVFPQREGVSFAQNLYYGALLSGIVLIPLAPILSWVDNKSKKTP